MDDPKKTSNHACNTASDQDAEQFEKVALEELKRFGFRITMARLQVIRALAESRSALSANDIHERISQSGGRIDTVSVYRILSTLQESGLVHHIGIADGYVACREAGRHQHPVQHLVCQDCGCIVESVPTAEMLESLRNHATEAGFIPRDIRIELMGVCSHCQPAAS